MLEEDSASLKKASMTAIASVSHFESTTKCQPDDDINVDCDSYGSMETLSDTVSITIDGEKHWVSGVDSTTTCADLICALLHYQNLEEKRCGVQNGNSSAKCIGKSNQITIQTKEDVEDVEEPQTYSKCLKNSHEYVIVKQLRNCHFEEYLDGSTRLLDVIPLRDNFGKKLCELQLRNLARTTPALTSSARVNNQNQNHNQLFSMLSMSTDKDSGMGSPVGSSRSERFRRRRGKPRGTATATATTTVATALQLHRQQQQPKRSKQQQQQQQRNNHNKRRKNIAMRIQMNA
ncbi:hypothetical protein ACLKA6_005057 [Drosophila palustris]